VHIAHAGLAVTDFWPLVDKSHFAVRLKAVTGQLFLSQFLESPERKTQARGGSLLSSLADV
jgi:hypothetical protein